MPRTPLRYKAKRPYVKVLVVILIVVLLFLMLPVPLPFNRTIVSNGLDPSRGQLSSIDCLWLSGSWSTSGAGVVILVIVSADGTVAFNNSVGFGTFSFYASDAPYTAVVYSAGPVTVQISGTAWGPVVAVGLP
jgi:hypothetical protein